MKRQASVALALFYLLSSAAAARAAGEDRAPDDALRSSQRAPSIHRSLESSAAAQFRRRYEQAGGYDESNCHPSRASLLARAVTEAGPDGFQRPEVRAQLTMLRKTLSRAERRESVKMRLLEANYQKHLQRQSLKLARLAPPVDRPRDPLLDELATQRADRRRRTGSADPR
ncbi:MAG: hypothetical protein AB7O59_12810 [Pirellulales bacterium]